ncbi:hypothetical protein AK830_g5735 [Neonectria ditissima]|uniref:Uncharacterized protein n=1 Tax=Neonectria ditissima TaxID=78410 RepID=A0A0N8H757_9HYPO|nr:hypothetical protein AK830_g5735 [Neonectria ditissima]
MDSFSVISLTSLGATISHRALSNAEELNELIATLDPQHASIPRLSTFSAALHSLHLQVSQLQSALDDSTAISLQLQTHLSQCLSSCDGILAGLSKQILRLEINTLPLLDETFFEVQNRALVAYSQLFAFFVKLLSVRERETQDAVLDAAEGTMALEQVYVSSQKAAQARDILLRGGQSPTTASSSKVPFLNDGSEPPPYEPAGSGSHRPATARRSSSLNFSKGMSSLTSSFKAMTSNLWAKPDPLATAFCQAALRGDVQQMSGFVAQGANINGRNGEGNTPLSCAILANKEDGVRFLLGAGADITSQTGSKLPPLFLAASVGSIGVAKLLIGKGAEVTQRNTSGQSFFTDVVASENIQGIQLLLEHGANPNTTNLYGRPVIAQGVKRNNLELVRLLLQYGAEAGGYDASGNSMIALAASQENVEMVRLLLSHGASAIGRVLSGSTVLVDSINKRRIEIASLLLEHGADANARDLYANPILVAVIKDGKLPESDKLETVRLLLSHGATPNVSDSAWSMPAICRAMETGSSALVKLLLQHGAPTDKKMKSGETLLLYAMDHGKTDQVWALLDHGADANATDKKGRTPLMQAIAKGDLDLVKKLQQHGADINLGGCISPVELAGAMNNPELLKVLGMDAPSVFRSQARQGSSGPVRSQSPPPGYDRAVGKH